MKSQFIDVKVTVEVITEEEISYFEAEKLARHEVIAVINAKAKTEQMCPPCFHFYVFA